MTEMTNFTQDDVPEAPYLYVSDDSLNRVTAAFANVLIPAFSTFGCLGNFLSLVVLVHHKMRNSTNSCLAALAVSDILVLLHSLLFAGITIISSYDPLRGRDLRITVYPFFGAYGSVVTARITSLLTTMLSIERFIAVYRPIKARQLCIKRHAHIGIAFIYVFTILVFIPLARKYHVITVRSPGTNRTMLILNKTEFGQNEMFYTCYGNILNVVFRILPLLLILGLNSMIAVAIRKTWSIRRTLSHTYPQNGSCEQNRITVMLLFVSCVFVVCILPGAVSSFISQIWTEYSRFGRARNLYHCVSYVAFFLETVNSSINFVIYMALSQKFWQTYKEIFCYPKTMRGKAKDIAEHQYIPLFRKRLQSSTTSMLSNPETRITLLTSYGGKTRSSVSSVGSLGDKNGHIKMLLNSERPLYRRSLDFAITERGKMEKLSSGREILEQQRAKLFGEQSVRMNSISQNGLQ